MQEIKGTEINEVKKSEPEGFKKIKPEKRMDIENVKKFVEKLFDKIEGTVDNIKDKMDGKEFGTQYNTEDHMIEHTPAEDSIKGHWKGERGNSEFVPNENTEAGLKAKEKLAEYGQDGVCYKNGEPDFSKCAEATVRIDDMTQNRDDYIGKDGSVRQGNFSQADIKCSEKWNAEAKDGKSDWTARDVKNWRDKNNCTWHERCDTNTMDLISRDIHNTKDPVFVHSGGVSECKKRDAINVEGEFDE